MEIVLGLIIAFLFFREVYHKLGVELLNRQRALSIVSIVGYNNEPIEEDFQSRLLQRER
jgi:hypothetical protein